jgi:hypothetical protein
MSNLDARYLASADAAVPADDPVIAPAHLLGKLADAFTQPVAMVAEVVLLPLLAVGFGLLASPSDPFWVHGAFPWLWLAPLIVALRYGPLGGIAGTSVLVMAWLLLDIGHLDNFPEVYFLGGLIVVMLAGEFASAWQTRTRRAETLQRYLDQRFQQLLHQHYLLRLSHDRLARELIGRPMSTHDALVGLRHIETGGAGDGRNMEALLRVLVEYCELECAAIHMVKVGHANARPTAVIGAYPKFDAGDALVCQALRTGKLCHISEAVATWRDSHYLVAVPLLDFAGSAYALLVVQDMPFLALQAENLQALQLVLNCFTDILSMNLLARPIIDKHPDCPLEFAFELERLAHLKRFAQLPSVVLALATESAASTQRLRDKVEEDKDELDRIWLVNRAERYVLAILIPLGTADTARDFAEKLERWMQGGHQQSLTQAGITVQISNLDGDDPAATVEWIHALADS